MFDKDFLWGVSSARYQVEGRGEGSKAECNWDDFAKKGGTLYGHNGDVTCDQYHNYKIDVEYMKKLGVKSYRLSISWSRIFPESSEKEYIPGFDYYHRIIDELLKNDIKPYVCLHHWDLPMYLMEKGGWCTRDTAYAFEIFAESVFKNLGSKVEMWSTILEPWCIAFQGYVKGEHAPGMVGETQKAFNVVHNLNLAHGLAVKKFRELKCKGIIGIILNLMYPRPARNCEEDITAADLAADETFYLFADPIFKKKYPERLFERRGITMPIMAGDMDVIAEKIDFLGVNYYTEDVVEFDKGAEDGFRLVNTYHKKNAMDWDIVPEGLYRLLKRVQLNYGNDIPIYITENGCAVYDKLNNDESRVHDLERIQFYKDHLIQLKRLVYEGVNIKGFYAWTLVDNFEWAYGFTKRFGLIYIDYQDNRRIPKDSYYFIREVIAGYESL